MFEITRYELDRRIRGTLVLSALLAAFGALMLAFFPSIQASGAALDEYVRNLPPALRSMFGVESITSIGGFLATELYQFVWTLLLGLYFAYRASSLVAADVETRRIDLLLAAPVSRSKIVLERFAALLPAFVLVNVVVAPVIYAGTVVLGEPISAADLAVVHLLSVPYFLACAGIGLVLSVLTDRESRANRVAVGLVFGLFLLDSLATSTDYGWIGAVSPTRYFAPTAILTRSEYDLVGAVVLLVLAAGLLLLARELFRREDVE
jgi:ABC-2 type transport system permease protein